MRIIAEGAIQRLTEVTGVHEGIYNNDTWHRLEAAKGTWLGELTGWVVANHIHWELPTCGMGCPFAGDVNLREWTETTWRGGRAPTDDSKQQRSGILQLLEREKITWLSDAVTAKRGRIRQALISWASNDTAGTEWLEDLRRLTTANPAVLMKLSLEGGERWSSRHLVGRILTAECGGDREEGRTEKRKWTLLVDQAVPQHGQGVGDEDQGPCDDRGYILGRVLVDGPREGYMKLGREVQLPMRSLEHVQLRDADLDKLVKAQERLVGDWTPPSAGVGRPETPEVRERSDQPMQNDERPFGWDPWHLENELEIGQSLIRNADTDDLVGCLEKSGEWKGKWENAMEQWKPEPDAMDPTPRELGRLHIYTDGGVQGEGRAGLYAWAVVAFGPRDTTGRPELKACEEGGGRFISHERRISSTRSETVALAAALTAVEPLLRTGRSVTVHIDNATVVDTFAKGRHRRCRGWSKLRDRDMWDQIEGVMQRTRAWGRTRVAKVAAHQDTKKQKDGKVKPWKDITLHEWGNVYADKVVDKMKLQSLQVDWKLGEGDTWGGGVIGTVGPVRAWI